MPWPHLALELALVATTAIDPRRPLASASPSMDPGGTAASQLRADACWPPSASGAGVGDDGPPPPPPLGPNVTATIVELVMPVGPKSRPSGPAATSMATPSSSSFSAAAAPFFLGCSSGGRSKRRQWADDNEEEADDDCPATFLDVARRLQRRSRSLRPPCVPRLVQSWL